MSARVLVAYASGTGCDSACATDIANQIADVPDLEVDVKPLSRITSIAPYAATYIGWARPSSAGRVELERFLNANAELLRTRPVWIVHHHPDCPDGSPDRHLKMTRLVFTPAPDATPAPAEAPSWAAPPERTPAAV
ncbi:hypothetical protein [Sporichthya polymorpha]|uniref:hypothetical protein n=1 Tax=Sporichthya polymorpha TaxID=35751 RepID=UPI0012EC7F14|nr:hypothetical protein [Sporichthya polymorpha]